MRDKESCLPLRFVFTFWTYNDYIYIYSFYSDGAGKLGIRATKITVVMSSVSITGISVGHNL